MNNSKLQLTKDELAAHLKEQHELFKRGSSTIPSLKASKEEWEAYRSTEESRKSTEAYNKLAEAVAYANEQFSEWHLGHIRNAAGISKSEWLFISDPKPIIDLVKAVKQG